MENSSSSNRVIWWSINRNGVRGRHGWPAVRRLLVGSNSNDILTRTFASGAMTIAEVVPTYSPAMDILKSSNVERVLFDLFGAARTRELMQQLDDDGKYQLDEAEHAQIREIFSAADCSDDEGIE